MSLITPKIKKQKKTHKFKEHNKHRLGFPKNQDYKELFVIRMDEGILGVSFNHFIINRGIKAKYEGKRNKDVHLLNILCEMKDFVHDTYRFNKQNFIRTMTQHVINVNGLRFSSVYGHGDDEEYLLCYSPKFFNRAEFMKLVKNQMLKILNL